jgi:hypothetical protein
MAESDRDHRNASRAGGRNGEPPRPRNRRRTLLNLGIPFVQVDDFLNQSEQAVALGYSVLVDTVNEIQAGYDQAKKFTESKEFKEWRQNPEGSPPPIPWAQVAESAENLQNVAFNAIREGTDIFLDSLRSGTKAMSSVAKTFEQSRKDVEAQPALAGPVFPDPIAVEVTADSTPLPIHRLIHHRGLTRLRINAIVSPALQLLTSPERRSKLDVKSVEFEPVAPKDDKNDVCQLTIDIGYVPKDQAPGDYDGMIRASNFELLIVKLRVTVRPKDSTTRYANERSEPTPRPTPWSARDASERADSTPRVRRAPPGRKKGKTGSRRAQ